MENDHENSKPVENQEPMYSEEWKQKLAELPEVSYQEAMDCLHGGRVVKEARVPFLNLNRLSFSHEIVFENCQMVGLVARGTLFKEKVFFRNCLFIERLEMSAHKEKEEFEKTVLEKGMEIRDSLFQETLMLRNAEVGGDFSLLRCRVDNLLSFDRAIFQGNVLLLGPGQIATCSFYQAQLSHHLNIQDCTFSGTPEKSLDLNKVQIAGILTLSGCHFQQGIEAKRARLGTGNPKSMVMENCTFENLDIRESYFCSEVQFSQVQGRSIVADIPREGHGQKSGRATVFAGDVAFLSSRFTEKCNFHGVRFQKYANFKKCVLEKGGDFNQSEFGQVVSFWETQSPEPIHFRNAHFSGRTQFGKVTFGAKSSFNEAVFDEETTFFDSEALGDIFFSYASFGKDFKIRSLKVQGGVGLQKITVEGKLKITDCEVKDRFILSESALNSSALISGFRVGTWGTLSKTLVRGELDMDGLQVGWNLPESKRNDKKEEPENNEKEEKKGEPEKEEKAEFIPGSFYLNEIVVHGVLDLSGANIHGQLNLEKANVYGEADLTRSWVGSDLVLDKSYFRGIVRIGSTRCEEIVSFKARFKEEVSFDAVKCRHIRLSASSFDGGFTMRGAQIDGKLNLNGVDVDGKADLFKCEFKEIFFRNFLVDHLLIDRASLGQELSSEKLRNYEQAQNEYGILKHAFLQRSQYPEMDWAYYNFCRNRRKARKTEFNPLRGAITFFDWLLLDLGFGYGTRPMNIAGVAFFVVLCFSLIYYLVPGGLASSSGQAMESLQFPQAVYLSAVAFVSMDYGECAPAFGHWLKYVFALEGVLGIFLMTLFVATISRKIIRT